MYGVADALPVGMAVKPGWLSVCCPSGVGNTSVGDKREIKIRLLCLDELLKLGYLSNLLECNDGVLFISIDCNTSRVISTIFKAR